MPATAADLLERLANPDLVTLTPGKYPASSTPIVFPKRVPVLGIGSQLRCSKGGGVEFPEPVGSIWAVTANGTDTTDGPLVRFGTDSDVSGGDGTKSHILDLKGSEPGPITRPGALGAFEYRNLQNSWHTNTRLENVRKVCNGLAITHGCKGVHYYGPWVSDCKEWSILVDSITGDQQNSKVVLEGGMAELTPTAIVVADAESVDVVRFCMNTDVGIHVRTAMGVKNPTTGVITYRTKKVGDTQQPIPESQRRCRELSIQGLRGNCKLFLKADYPVTITDFGGHTEAFYTQMNSFIDKKWPNITLVPAVRPPKV